MKSPQTPFKMGVNGQLIFCLYPALILTISPKLIITWEKTVLDFGDYIGNLG